VHFALSVYDLCRLEQEFKTKSDFTYSVEELEKGTLFEFAIEEEKDAYVCCTGDHEIPSPSTIHYIYIEKEVVGRIEANTFPSSIESLSHHIQEYVYRQMFLVCKMQYDALYVIYIKC